LMSGGSAALGAALADCAEAGLDIATSPRA